MGFDQQDRRKTYELSFKPYPGLTVWCRKPGFQALEELATALAALGDDLAGEELATDGERIRWWGVLFRAFARSLLRWNLLDGRVAVPVTDALEQDHEFLLALARTWYMVVVLNQEVGEPTAAPRHPGADEELRAAVLRERQLAEIAVIDHDPEDDTVAA